MLWLLEKKENKEKISKMLQMAKIYLTFYHKQNPTKS